ncbi:unnamed protein product [Ectocarpus sp. CCAP 1310/34]|nr:unnamed protein product [Ectocarpus sp. CCAP 1310/34]
MTGSNISHDTADARSADEDDNLESGGDDMVNPAGSDIRFIDSAGADFLSTGGDIESRRSDIESGSSGVQSREAIGAAGNSSLSGEEKQSVRTRSVLLLVHVIFFVCVPCVTIKG